MDPTISEYNAQQSLQDQQIDGNVVLNAPEMYNQVNQNQAVLVAQTDPVRVIRTIILRLKGQMIDEGGTVHQVIEPKMNKIGIENVWFILDSFINDNLRFSHLTDREIGKIMEGLQKDLVNDLSLNWKLYEIQRKTDLDVINNSILINVFACLKRAEGQNEKNWLGKISVETIRPNNTPVKKESWINKLRI